MKIVDFINKALIGKKLEHVNSHNRKIILEIESFHFKIHNREITPSTQENDWYSESTEWTTYTLTFVDGSTKDISLNEELKFVN